MTVGRAVGAVSGATCSALDASHRIMLRIRLGERATAPTRRVRFSPEQQLRISRRQGNRCMYCGVTLNRNNRQLDHIYPVEFGGPNDEENLQALCGGCNARKGVQTDSDFRARYRELLASVPVGQPPAKRIPQARFTAITRISRQGETTRALRRSVFRTPQEKIAFGSLILGGVIGAVWFLIIAILLGGTEAGRLTAFFSGLAVLGTTWAGSM